jgi:AraC-like DNA-binding protein
LPRSEIVTQGNPDELPPCIYLWPDRFFYLGPSFGTARHRHHAAQVLVGLDGPFRLRGDASADWCRLYAALIDTDTPHLADATGTGMTALYVEPESAVYAAMRKGDHFRAGALSPGLYDYSVSPDLHQALNHARNQGADCTAAWRLGLALLRLQDELETAPERDPRVEAALSFIRGDYAGLDDLARRVHLSPSRLAHLFREQVGVAIRRYVLWARLRHAVQYALNRASLTETAHAVGFTDSAHLSNSFRQMFGLPPSFLFDRRIDLDVHLC